MSTKTKSTSSGSKIRPLGDHVLVIRTEAESKTAGGILLPDSAKEKPREGKVIAIGEGRVLDSGERATFSVKVGDRVLFTPYGGTEVKFGGQDYLIMEQKDIFGVIEG